MNLQFNTAKVKPASRAPIGVFDSGIGGLTVLKELMRTFPLESFIYLGDTARLPYGSKSEATIGKYLEQNVAFLQRYNVKAVVVACSSASSVVRQHFSELGLEAIPVYDVIRPGAAAALASSLTRRVGVIGTLATVGGGAYDKALLSLDPSVEIISQACPLFVPLVEDGFEEGNIVDGIVEHYLSDLSKSGRDTLILGCTHYSVLRKSIQKIMGSEVKLIDSGEALSKSLLLAGTVGVENAVNVSVENRLRILVTDSSSHFMTIAQRLFPEIIASVWEHVDLG
jgi:glutamate racemase